jgi:hypothetical protein
MESFKFEDDKSIFGFVITDINGSVIKKEFKSEIDFEISSFLESIFWEKMIIPYYEMLPMFRNTFNVNLNPNMIIKTRGINFILLFLEQRVLSIALSGEVKESRIKQIIEDIQKKIKE